MCRTLGTIIGVCGIEHAGFVFWHFFKTATDLENPLPLLLFSIGPMLVALSIALIPVLRSFQRLLDVLFPAVYILSKSAGQETKAI